MEEGCKTLQYIAPFIPVLFYERIKTKVIENTPKMLRTTFYERIRTVRTIENKEENEMNLTLQNKI